VNPAEVHAPRNTMSLRALLHLLYERAGFNRWYPAMEGRRNQGVLHKYLCEAARGVRLKGVALDERLYVPEPFRTECKAEVGERRRRKLALLLSPEDAVQFKMAILIGEYNGSEATTFARRIVVKHMPDAPVYIENKAWERVERSYSAILQARDADVERKPHVMMAALIYAKCEHVYQADTLCMMLTTDQWIPLDGLHELPLIEALQREQRAFIKPLRFDAKGTTAFPSALLLDCGQAPMALHVLSKFSNGKERSSKEKDLTTKVGWPWVWRTETRMPPLPKAAVPRA